MEQRTNKYHLTLRLEQPAEAEDNLEKQLELDFENHDEIFDIIERVHSKKIFASSQQSTEFAIGLRMFSEIVIKNQRHPLFNTFMPCFVGFMKNLKSFNSGS